MVLQVKGLIVARLGANGTRWRGGAHGEPQGAAPGTGRLTRHFYIQPWVHRSAAERGAGTSGFTTGTMTAADGTNDRSPSDSASFHLDEDSQYYTSASEARQTRSVTSEA